VKSILNDDGNNYMMSVADVMSGLMFIFIITLAIFVVDFMVASKEHENKIQKLAQVLSKLDENALLRAQMLRDMQSKLAELDVDVDVDQEHGVLRLNENAIRFTTGSSELNIDQLDRLRTVANVLSEILPCYGANPPAGGHCLPETAAKLDSVFIEGHTDNVPIGGRLAQIYEDNWALSASRAIYTYRQVVEAETMLGTMVNKSQQPVISVSGYGAGRPVPGHEHTVATNDPINRRIDFRFIMTPPSFTETQAALKGNL
jgi:chemotaxis protein MotB